MQYVVLVVGPYYACVYVHHLLLMDAVVSDIGLKLFARCIATSLMHLDVMHRAHLFVNGYAIVCDGTCARYATWGVRSPVAYMHTTVA